MNTIKKYLAIGAMATTMLTGCGKILRDAPIMEVNMLEANGYTVMVHYLGDKNSAAEIKIGNYKTEGSTGFSNLIYAIERDGDGRIDEIKLLAPKGSSLEELASVDKVGQIFSEFQKKHPKE